MEIQKIQERFEDLMLANPDFDESLLEKDEEGCYVDSDIADMYSMFEAGTEVGEAWQAAKASALPKRMHLNCCQLMQATNFGAPVLTKWPKKLDDEMKFLLETEMVIEYQKNGHRGDGFYCWYEDLPEEGSIFLEEMIKAQEPTND